MNSDLNKQGKTGKPKLGSQIFTNAPDFSCEIESGQCFSSSVPVISHALSCGWSVVHYSPDTKDTGIKKSALFWKQKHSWAAGIEP